MTDWTNPKSSISKYFTVEECLFLPSWNTLHIPSETEKTNILLLANKMDKIREYLDKPIITHVWLRPILNNPLSTYNGQDYNAFVGGAKASAHIVGKAIDFHVEKLSTDDVKALLIPKLDYFNIRLENNGPKASWIHIDIENPHPHRFFLP